MDRIRLRAATLGIVALFPSIAPASARADEPPDATGDAWEPLGLDVRVDVATAYAFRGLNLFAGGSQHDVHALAAPGVTWTHPEIGLSIGWWAAFQATGGNRLELIDGGTGHEQDFFVAYETELIENTLAVGGFLYTYLYPFADEETAGAAVPAYLEPGARVSWSNAIDLTLEVSVMAGLQDALAGGRYVSLRPSVARTFALGDAAELTLGLTLGYKGFVTGDGAGDNAFDVQIDCTLALWPAEGILFVEPGLHAAWTNLSDVGFAEEYFLWAGLGVGAGI